MAAPVMAALPSALARVLRCLENSRLLTSVRVINGLEPKQLREYLEGKDVGTHITNSRYKG